MVLAVMHHADTAEPAGADGNVMDGVVEVPAVDVIATADPTPEYEVA
jgi:hypothetical protein